MCVVAHGEFRTRRFLLRRLQSQVVAPWELALPWIKADTAHTRHHRTIARARTAQFSTAQVHCVSFRFVVTGAGRHSHLSGRLARSSMHGTKQA